MTEKLSMNFGLRDQACSRGLGTYYARIYTSRELADFPRVTQRHLGRDAITASELIIASSRGAEDPGSELSSQLGRQVRPQAAAILRLCMEHDEPTVEAVSNAIVASSDYETFEVTGQGHGLSYNDGSRVQWLRDPRISSIWDNRIPVTYLPHETYDVAGGVHQVITSPSGLGFGLLGGEELVQETDLRTFIY